MNEKILSDFINKIYHVEELERIDILKKLKLEIEKSSVSYDISVEKHEHNPQRNSDVVTQVNKKVNI